MKSHKFALVFLATTISLSTVHADWLSDAVAFDMTQPGSYQTQVRGVYTLGDLQVRTPEMGLIRSPLRVSAPKISAGCGGVSIEGGSLQFLLNDFVEGLKKMSAAAPAFAFQIALKWLCPECASTLQELKGIGDKLNGMSLDGCTAMQAGADWAGKALENIHSFQSVKGTGDKTWREKVVDWTKGSEVYKTVSSGINDFNAWLDEKGADTSTKNAAMLAAGYKGSLVHNFVEKIKYQIPPGWFGGAVVANGGQSNAEKVIRAITGDIIGAVKAGDSNESKLETQPVRYTFTENDITALLEGNGSTITVPKVTIDANGNAAVDGTEQVTITEGVKPYVKRNLDSILTKLKVSLATNTRQSLDDEEKRFLTATPLPIYRILNTQAILGAAEAKKTDELANQIAQLQLDAYLAVFIGQMKNHFANYNNTHMGAANEKTQDTIEALQANLETVEALIFNAIKKETDLYEKTQSYVRASREVDQMITATLARHGIFSRKQVLGF